MHTFIIPPTIAVVAMSEATDNGRGASIFAGVVDSAENGISQVEQETVEEMSDEQLVDVRVSLKELEDTVEDVRKELVEPELDERVDPGERLHGLHRVQSHRKYVAEDVGSVIGRAAALGIDFTDFVSLDASTLADEHPDLAEIGVTDYTYYR